MITIYESAAGYTAEVKPPQGNGIDEIYFDEPMPRDDLIKKLMEVGCHQTDIGDAFKFRKQRNEGVRVN